MRVCVCVVSVKEKRSEARNYPDNIFSFFFSFFFFLAFCRIYTFPCRTAHSLDYHVAVQRNRTVNLFFSPFSFSLFLIFNFIYIYIYIYMYFIFFSMFFSISFFLYLFYIVLSHFYFREIAQWGTAAGWLSVSAAVAVGVWSRRCSFRFVCVLARISVFMPKKPVYIPVSFFLFLFLFPVLFLFLFLLLLSPFFSPCMEEGPFCQYTIA